jgi:hypothetical protein
MYSTNSSMYSMRLQSRAICPLNASRERTRFAIGSCSAHEENVITILSYKDDSSLLEPANIYLHPDQIWSMQTSYADPTKIMTCGQPKSGPYSVKLWSMQNQTLADIEGADDLGSLGGSSSSGSSSSSSNNSNDPLPLDELAEVGNIDSNSSHHIAWHRSKESTLVTSSTYVALVDLTETSAEIVKKMSVEVGTAR